MFPDLKVELIGGNCGIQSDPGSIFEFGVVVGDGNLKVEFFIDFTPITSTFGEERGVTG